MVSALQVHSQARGKLLAASQEALTPSVKHPTNKNVHNQSRL
jgi:hypothetical protein